MIAALYARYSSDGQREESIVAQIRAEREHCKRKGYTIIKEYADEAQTGTNDNRPAWKQMMRDAQAGLFEVLICHNVDRMGRQEYDYYKNKFVLSSCGIDVEFAGQLFDTSTPEGKLVENNLVGAAAYFSRNLSKEVKKGHKENVLTGRTTGGKPLFGYSIVHEPFSPRDKTFAINEYEAEAVRYIFKAYLAGDGYLKICHWLNTHGYITRRGRPFGKNSLHDMLCNRRYIGTAIYGKNTATRTGRRNSHRADPPGMTIAEDVCPAIIDKETFRKVAEKMISNRRMAGSYRAKESYLLSGIVYCGICGSLMTGTASRNSQHKKYLYYKCSRRDRQSTDVCANRSVPARDLEKLILAQIDKIFFAPGVIDKLIAKIQKIYNANVNTQAAQLVEMKKRYDAKHANLDKMYDAIELTGELDEFDRVRMDKIKNELRSIRDSIATLELSSPHELSKAYIKEYIEQYRMDIHNGTSSDLKNLIHAFVERVTVTPDKITIRYKFEFNGADERNRTSTPCGTGS